MGRLRRTATRPRSHGLKLHGLSKSAQATSTGRVCFPQHDPTLAESAFLLGAAIAEFREDEDADGHAYARVSGVLRAI